MVDKYNSISYDSWAGQMLTINKWSKFNKRQRKLVNKGLFYILKIYAYNNIKEKYDSYV